MQPTPRLPAVIRTVWPGRTSFSKPVRCSFSRAQLGTSSRGPGLKSCSSMWSLGKSMENHISKI